MKIIKKILKWLLFILAIPVIYLIVSILLSYITVSRDDRDSIKNITIYLSTNGVHLDIIIPKTDNDSLITSGLDLQSKDQFIAYGWGDENFYINTPTWGDLTAKNACSALFLDSSTLMHVTRHAYKREEWVAIQLDDQELFKLNSYLRDSFKKDDGGRIMKLDQEGYTSRDDFY